MTSIVLKKLNSTETILKSMPKIIEAFTTFYGEEERENIQRKFNNMLAIGYCNPEKIESIIRRGNDKASKEIIEKLLNSLNIENEQKENFKKTYFDNENLENSTLHPLFKYIQYLNEPQNTYFKEKAVKFLKETSNEEVTIDNIDKLQETGAFKKYESIIIAYKNAIIEYQKSKEKFKLYNKYIEQCKELEKTLSKKYSQQLVDEFKYLFTEEELKKIDQEFNSKYFTSIKYVNKKTENLFGYSLNNGALIDAFSEESDKVLENGNEWRKKSIIEDRIKYFKNLGVDLGNDYQTYLEHPELKKIFPALKDLAEKIKTKKNELYTKMQNEYYKSLPEYTKNIQRIDQEGLLDKNHGYNANAYELNSTFISTNIKKTENGYIMYPILCVSMGGSEEYLDHVLIHELNHVYELHLNGVKENKYFATCGWELLDGEFINQNVKEAVSLEENKEKRNYELFNEIINELISQEITEILFESNGYIFNTKEEAKIKGGSSYEFTKFVVKEFYDTYKKAIIESRKEGNISVIYEAVGKENFDALNELFHLYNESFTGMTIYNVIMSLKKGEETEKTKIYKEIIERKEKILEEMEFYNKNKSHTL